MEIQFCTQEQNKCGKYENDKVCTKYCKILQSIFYLRQLSFLLYWKLENVSHNSLIFKLYEYLTNCFKIEVISFTSYNRRLSAMVNGHKTKAIFFIITVLPQFVKFMLAHFSFPKNFTATKAEWECYKNMMDQYHQILVQHIFVSDVSNI